MRPLLALCVLIALQLPLSAFAAPRATRLLVDEQGQACVSLTQRQIFDEVGGQAALAIDFAQRLATLTSALELPDEVGQISGDAWAHLLPQSVTALTRFTYVPPHRRVELDLDYHAVQDGDSLAGANRFSLRYPLSLERLAPRVAGWLGRTAYSVKGHAAWKHYTEAEGHLSVEVRDPALKREKRELKQLDVKVSSGVTTDFSMHFEVIRGSQLHQVLASRQQLEAVIPGALRELGIICQDARVSEVRVTGESATADVVVKIHGLRQTVINWQVDAMRRFRLKGVRREDVAAALATMLEVDFPSAAVVVKREADHFSLDATLQARRTDQAVLGYLRLQEVLEPPLVRAGTQNENLSALVASINRVRTKRFRNVVAAASSSSDGGDCDFTFNLQFPKKQVDLKAGFEYKSDLKAWYFALQQMGVPLTARAWSVVKARSSGAGIEGHALHEAQGPWQENLWALLAEAAKGHSELQAVFPEKGMPSVQEGRLVLRMVGHRVTGAGSLRLLDWGAWEQAAGAGGLRPLAWLAKYDADKAPGKILIELFARGDSKASAATAAHARFGAKVPLVSGTVNVPAIAAPLADIPPTFGPLIEADRKALAVTPWQPPQKQEQRAEEADHGWVLAMAGGGAVLAAAGLGFWFVRRRQQVAEEQPSNRTILASDLVIARAAPRSKWDAADEAMIGPPPCLRVAAGAEVGRVIELTERDHELGRGEPRVMARGRIEFAEPTISSVQAQLKWDAPRRVFLIEHEPGATNPTLVNDRSVKRHELRHGDNVRMGNMVLVYEQT